MKLPRILVAAPSSGTGKTLITCGILQALVNRGLNVCSFKCGPDYIDPMFHKKVIGTHSTNIDTFFADKSVIDYLMGANGRDKDIAVFEGVMGYYDGLGGTTDKASTYEVAKTTDTPVILVINCKGMSLSVAAMINGFLKFRDDSNIKGIILNQTTEAMCKILGKLIQDECGIPVVGYVPKFTDCLLESRHLGLVMPDEIDDLKARVHKMARILEETLDFDLLLEIASSANEIDENIELGDEYKYHTNKPVRIGVARDEAFCFIYHDNMRLLENMGAEIVEFSPIHDETLPDDIDGMLLYGGYPELFARELSANKSMKDSIRDAINDGMPCMAECGGFIYLHRKFEDIDGEAYDGVGIIDALAYRTSRLRRFGYIDLTYTSGEFAHDVGRIPAHEFHYYDSESNGETFEAKKPIGTRSWDCIHQSSNLMAGFPHLYYYGNTLIPQIFLNKCERYR